MLFASNGIFIPQFTLNEFRDIPRNRTVRTPENSSKRVVFGGRYRVKRMVVATGATHGYPEKGSSDGTELLVHDLHAQKGFVLQLVIMWPEGKKTGSRKVFVVFLVGRGVKQIARNLLLGELIERLVLVIAVDDVFAVVRGIGEGVVASSPSSICITSHIKPMPPPAFPETGGIKQFVHHLDIGIWRIVCVESLDFLEWGWQSGQVEIGSTKQSCLVCQWSRFQIPFLDLGQDVTIEFVHNPCFVLNRWWLKSNQRKKGPELSSFFQALTLWSTAFMSEFHGCVPWIGSTHRNPFHKVGHYLLR